MRRLTVLVVLAAVLVLGRPPSLAGACSCIESSVAEEVARAEVVFSGTVVSSRPVSGPDDTSSGRTFDHVVEVDRVYKGDADEEVIVVGAEDTASCGYAFDPGRYLVYGTEEDGRIHTSLCSATTTLPSGTPVPAELGEGRAPTPVPDDGGSDEEPDGRGADEGAAPSTTWPPIGGPEGDVVEPSTWDTFGPALLVGGGVVAVAALVVGLLAGRRRSA